MGFDELSPETRRRLEDAGWFPARRVPTLAPADHPAEPILAALSGLRVGQTGSGETCARSDIAFFLIELEPDDDLIREWARLLGTVLVGLGEVHHGHGELWMASDGRCFGRSLVHEAFYFEGEDFAEALEGLLRGRRARPLLRPDEESVTLYGDLYTHDHPDLYDFTRRESLARRRHEMVASVRPKGGTMSIDELLNGHAPTEAWLATEDARRLLSDADRRTTLYRAMHPQPEPSHAPLLRTLLAHEVAFRSDPSSDDDDRFENLYWCGLLLSQIGDVRDVLPLWRAKRTNFDTGFGFDVQFLVGAGVEETLAFLARSEDPAASEAAAYITSCAEAGDFDDLDERRASRIGYFGEV